MSYIRLPVSIYIVNDDNTETLSDRRNIFVPFYDSIEGLTLTTGGDVTPASAITNFNQLNSVDWVKKGTYFYIYDSENVPLVTSEYVENRIRAYGGVPFDVTSYIGKTFKMYIDGDLTGRYIKCAIPDLTQSSTATTKQSFTWFNILGYGNNNSFTSYSSTAGQLQVRSYVYLSSTSTRTAYACTMPWSDGAVSYSNYQQLYWTEYIIPFTTRDEYRCQLTRISTSQADIISDWIDGYVPDMYDGDNPYEEGGYSEPSESNGNFSEASDNPVTDAMPNITAVGTGFATIFTPSLSQLRALSGLFWSSNVFDFFQNLVENINEMFVSLAMVPFEVDNIGPVSVTWIGIDTAVTLDLAGEQFYEFDMGSIDLSNDERIFTSGSALDYSPYSRLGIYLPFIGNQELDIDECRNAVVNLRYRIDILSGDCIAIINIDGTDLYQFAGNCLTQIPITSQNMESLVSNGVNIAIAAAGVGASNTMAGAAVEASQASKDLTDSQKQERIDARTFHSRSSLASATANASMGMKPVYKKTGAIGGSTAMLAVKQPYLFLTTPVQSMPENYERYCGFPSNITATLGSLDGYTVVEDIRLNGLVATSEEVEEIYSLLKGGVII